MNNTLIYHNIINTYLKKEHGSSLEDLAKATKLSVESTKEIISSNDNIYRIIDDTVILNGLGTKLCIVCGEHQNHNPISIAIPQDLIKGRTLDQTLKKQYDHITGHANCYRDIGAVFREKDNVLHCIDCSNFHGQWIDGDEVKEECYKLKLSEVGHKGCIAYNTICNHFDPDMDMKKGTDSKEAQKMEFWKQIQPATGKKTFQGYQNILQILEKSKLLR